jgi:DNA-binding transcriptional MerR regulator/methylmalonyl-CoA mutase cobalamin-binding subunit
VLSKYYFDNEVCCLIVDGVYTFPIQTVAERTGLSAHAIRAWERRYQAIEPARSPGRHRMYSEADLHRLNLLAEASRTGRQINALAKMSNEELQALLGRKPDSRPPKSAVGIAPSGNESGDRALCAQALEAVRRLDTLALDDALQRAQVCLGDQGLLRRVITPLARELGELWRSGKITAAQEHFFTAMAKMFIWNMTRQYKPDRRDPRMVVGTPAGQFHEIGARIVSAVAANHGWNVIYVGTSLPSFELAGAVEASGASALALSIIFPLDDPRLPGEIEVLGRLLPRHIRILVGGQASAAYRPALQAIGARVMDSLDELDTELDSLRRRPLKP